MCFCVTSLITGTHFSRFYNEPITLVGRDQFFPLLDYMYLVTQGNLSSLEIL